MPEENSQPLDWLNLPPRASLRSLWDCLHDAEIRDIQSNLLDRNLTIRFRSFYISSFHSFAPDLEFVFQLAGVQSARALRWELWPGGCTLPEGISREEENRLVSEYRAKWREESISWPEVESRLRKEKDPPDVIDASIATAENETVALHFSVQLASGEYYDLFIRAAQLTVSRNDAVPINLNGFIALGEAYWKDYASRRKSPSSA